MYYLTTTIPAKSVNCHLSLSPTMQMLSFTTQHNIHINITLWHVCETAIAMEKQ